MECKLGWYRGDPHGPIRRVVESSEFIQGIRRAITVRILLRWVGGIPLDFGSVREEI